MVRALREYVIFVGNAVEGMMGAANWVKDAAVSVWDGVAGAVSTVAGVVGDFVEKTGNWVSEGYFKTNEQVEEIRAQERIEEAIRNGTALQEGSAEYNRMMSVLYGKPEVKAGAGGTGEMSHAEYMQKFREMEEKNKNYDIGSNLKKLTDLAQQNNGGSKYVREEIEKALDKIPGGKNLDVDKILKTSCVSLSVWVALKQAGADVGDYGDFYVDQVKKGNISVENASVNKIYDVANSYTIDGKKPEIGFTRDFNEYDKLLASGQVNNGVVFFKTLAGNHALNVYFSNEGTKISDVSYRTHGNLASEYVENENYRWLFYVKKRGK